MNILRWVRYVALGALLLALLVLCCMMAGAMVALGIAFDPHDGV